MKHKCDTLLLALIVLINTAVNAAQQAYLKASNTGPSDGLFSVAMSGDTLVIGAYLEDSSAIGVNGDQGDEGAMDSGAVYVFVRDGTSWSQQAYLKASNTGTNDSFGSYVAISGDTLVVGATNEASNATGVNGNQNDNSAFGSGAAYVFVRHGTNWTQQAYLKAFNTDTRDNFGSYIAISDDTLAIGAQREDSTATGVNGDGIDNSALNSGAAYIFVRDGTNWSQQAYVKASNTDAGDLFGSWLSLSGDTLVVSANLEDSGAIGVDGHQNDNSAIDSGAAYVFVRDGTNWSQQAYLKASNTEANDQFGVQLAVSGDTVVVSAWREDSAAAGVNGNQNDNMAVDSGAAYVFVRDGTNWSQQAYLKASNTEAGDLFGRSVAISADTLVIGAPREDSGAIGVNGDERDNSVEDSGAAYAFVRYGTTWAQQAYLKASNTGVDDRFGLAVAVSGDTVGIGAILEDSNATGVNGDGGNNSAPNSGAAYIFAGLGPSPRLVIEPEATDGNFIRLDGVRGWGYALERASNIAGPWDTIDAQVAPSSGQIEFYDFNPGTGQAFYRVAVEVPAE